MQMLKELGKDTEAARGKALHLWEKQQLLYSKDASRVAEAAPQYPEEALRGHANTQPPAGLPARLSSRGGKVSAAIRRS